MAEQEADYEIEPEVAEQEADYEIKPDEIGPDKKETHDELIELNEEPTGKVQDHAEPTEDALDEQATIHQTMTDTYGERSEEHNLRPRRPRDYSHPHATLEGIAMTQHSVKKGFEGLWGRRHTSIAKGTTTTT
jgi:hypothetical protein